MPRSHDFMWDRLFLTSTSPGVDLAADSVPRPASDRPLESPAPRTSSASPHRSAEVRQPSPASTCGDQAGPSSLHFDHVPPSGTSSSTPTPDLSGAPTDGGHQCMSTPANAPFSGSSMPVAEEVVIEEPSAAPIVVPEPRPVAEGAPRRPATRLQHGVHKPKVYTDGTVRYGHLATVDEPATLDIALNTAKWRATMDSEI